MLDKHGPLNNTCDGDYTAYTNAYNNPQTTNANAYTDTKPRLTPQTVATNNATHQCRRNKPLGPCGCARLLGLVHESW